MIIAIDGPAASGKGTLARKLALESLNDVPQSATELMESQKAWFLAHPPPKDDGKAPHS